jgi:hypothetical protein
MDGSEDVEFDPVAAFAQQLGILPAEEAQFTWLAEVGLQSPLPSRWTRHEDTQTGCIYYVDNDRQVSCWENPLVPYLRRLVEIGREYLQNPSLNFFEEQKGTLWHQHKHDLDHWHGPFIDPEGRSYFVNSTDGVSSWQDPRVDAQYIFELESGLLSTFSAVMGSPSSQQLPDGDIPLKTASGSEVLKIDDTEADTLTMKRTKSAAMSITKSMSEYSRKDILIEQQSVLDKMARSAEWLRNAQKDEEESQRLQFDRKIKERSKRCREKKDASPVTYSPLERAPLRSACDSMPSMNVVPPCPLDGSEDKSALLPPLPTLSSDKREVVIAWEVQPPLSFVQKEVPPALSALHGAKLTSSPPMQAPQTITAA